MTPRTHLAFYLSCLLAFIGGHLVNYSVILYLQEKIGSDVLSGIGFGLSFGSSIIFGWFAGVLCDRVAPGRVIHAAQALFLCSLAGLWWVENGVAIEARVPWILFSALLSGIAWSFVGPARMTTLAQITQFEKLKPATIIFNLQVMLGFGLAPIVIGVLRSHWGWSQVFMVGMGLFVGSSLLLVGLPTRAAQHSGASVRNQMAEGFTALRANPLLAQLMLAAIIAYAMTGPMQILLPKLAKQILGLDELQRGLYLGLMALSLIIGGIGALVVSKRVHVGKTIFIGTVLACLCFASLSQWHSPALSATFLTLMAVLGGMVISLIVAGIQSQAPEHLRGRIMSYYAMISQIIPAASGVCAGVLVKQLDVMQAIAVAGLGLALVACVGAMGMRRLRNTAH